jgi:hypothetical protein
MPEQLAKSPGIHDPSPEQLIAIGLIQVERIVRTAIGYNSANIVVPFDEAFRTLALSALAAVNDREREIHCAHEALDRIGAGREDGDTLSDRIEIQHDSYGHTIASLRARLESATRDTKRLDWLEQTPFTSYRSGEISHETVVVVDESRSSRRGHVFGNLREAIDSAMSKP